MLSNTFEWERLIHPTPTEEMITRRKAIVSYVLESFDSDQNIDEIFRLVSAALTGLSPSVAADVEYGAILTEITRKHQQAFPALLSENALDLQLTACLTVGELLTRKKGRQFWMEPQTAVAALCLSTAGIMLSVKGVHLDSVREMLLAKSRERLSLEAISVRQRIEHDYVSKLNELSPPGDVPTFWNELKPRLIDAFDSLRTASAIDRDELEVLWWIYNNTSQIFGNSLSEMAAYDVALACSIELVDRGLCPAPASLNEIVLGKVARASNKPSGAGKPLKTIVAAWPVEIISSIVPADVDERTLVATWPKVLPLTWIATKIADSGVSTGWEQEFASRTGGNVNMKITPEALARQVFAERTAQRLLSRFAGEES